MISWSNGGLKYYSLTKGVVSRKNDRPFRIPVRRSHLDLRVEDIVPAERLILHDTNPDEQCASKQVKTMTEPDTTAYHPFIGSEDEDEHIVLEDCEVDVRAHGPDKASEPHTHEETHIIFVRTGEMHWEVEGEEFHAEAGDTIVTPPETEHEFEVVGGEPANTTCLIAPSRSSEDQGPSGTHEITKPEEV